MKFEEMARVMAKTFDECQTLRDAGQKEYAGEGADCFDNFNRLQLQLRLDRKQVLMVYAMKHLDGITSFIHGHKSQREDVRGRINDLIVYLVLLRGMIEEDECPKIIATVQAAESFRDRAFVALSPTKGTDTREDADL